jgi:hypothetical protein
MTCFFAVAFPLGYLRKWQETPVPIPNRHVPQTGLGLDPKEKLGRATVRRVAERNPKLLRVAARAGEFSQDRAAIPVAARAARAQDHASGRGRC